MCNIMLIQSHTRLPKSAQHDKEGTMHLCSQDSLMMAF